MKGFEEGIFVLWSFPAFSEKECAKKADAGEKCLLHPYKLVFFWKQESNKLLGFSVKQAKIKQSGKEEIKRNKIIFKK